MEIWRTTSVIMYRLGRSGLGLVERLLCCYSRGHIVERGLLHRPRLQGHQAVPREVRVGVRVVRRHEDAPEGRDQRGAGEHLVSTGQL